MNFTTLSETTQNLLLMEFSFLYKSVVLFGGLVFALFYLFYWKKNKEQPTPFYTIGGMRIAITTISWISIVTLPLSLLLLSPEYGLDTFVGWLIPLYLTFVGLGFVTIMIDSFYYLPTVLLKFGGFDITDPKVNKVYQKAKKQFKR